MTWTKLSDDFGDDCWELSDSAFRLHVEALCWSNRKLLDLRIPQADVERYMRASPDAAGELVDLKFWKLDGDHFVIRHHANYQRTREQVIHQQETNKANRAKGKARAVKATDTATSGNDSSDEPSDEHDDERDGTGSGSGSGTTHREEEQRDTHARESGGRQPSACLACGGPAYMAINGRCRSCASRRAS